MIRRATVLILLCFLFLSPLSRAAAQTPQSQVQPYYKAEVVDVTDSGIKKEFGQESPYQTLTVRVLDGDIAGKTLGINHGSGYSLDPNQLVKKGQLVVVTLGIGQNGTAEYQIVDAYRLDQISTILFIFFGIILILSGWRGFGAIVGMFMSLGVIVWYIVPQILAGKDPLFVSVSGGLGIMITTMYLAHGFSKRTTISVVSTFIALVVTGIIATISVKLAHLTGLGTEDATALRLGTTGYINLKGLLLGGIIIGTLGVLDDVTTGLVASVSELVKSVKKPEFSSLYKSGLEVGKEHIASLVNTLVLAYAGAALPVFLVIVLNPNHVPLWVILNSEIIMEEVVRTVSGSIGLLTAVPITSFLAATYHRHLHSKLANEHLR